MKKILNLFSLFFSVISLCTATLVCHIIFIYPNLNHNTAQKNKGISSQNTAIIQANNNTDETAIPVNTYQDEHPEPEAIPVSSISDNNQDTAVQPMPQAEAVGNGISSEYQTALSKANDYSNIMYMSKAAIYDQLTSEYGERFSPDAAQYAIDNMSADWNFNALQKAKNYSDTMYMSKTAIYDQLISDHGERFTPSEAQYAIENITADWNYNALQKAKDYQTTMNMSPDAIHDQLVSEYGERFSLEEANYAVANITTNNNTGNESVLYTVPVEQGNSSSNYIASNPVQDTVAQITSENDFNTYDEPQPQVSTLASDIVWLSASGEKYHSVNDCGRMDPEKARAVSRGDAINQGYEPCSKCIRY